MISNATHEKWERESQAEKESTNADLDDELDDDLNNFGNVFQEVQYIYAQSNSLLPK